eukprot:gb/GECG01015327.1/.p1 GENE.gb/GECG01015327.1/~~gb/GECG01015327.1/.p1  ORF type:complete len:672 (+),score=102.65 gb/GECG01015327.1/:1-2016(+)
MQSETHPTASEAPGATKDEIHGANPEGETSDPALSLRKQIEFYFSKENLATDQFLISQMTTMDLYVPISVIASFSKVKALTAHLSNPLAAIRDAIKNSDEISMNEDGTQVKPNVKTERDTLILREIPSDTPKERIETLFTESGSDKPVDIRTDIGDTWFVRMESEQAAVKAFSNLRSQKFEGKPVKARLKSENPLRKLLGAASAPSRQTTQTGQSAMNPNSPEMYPGMSNQQSFINPDGSPLMTAGAYTPMIANYFAATSQRNQPGKFGEFVPSSAPSERSNSTVSGGRERQDSVNSQSSIGGASTSSQSSFGWDPMSNTELPEGPPPPAGYAKEFIKYQSDDILRIVKAIPRNRLARPESMDPKKHSRAVLSEPNTQLIQKQRTWSMENGLQQGRPRIDSTDSLDSVNSTDYSSMMYGEDRQHKRKGRKAQDSNESWTNTDGGNRQGKSRSNSGYAAFSGKEKKEFKGSSQSAKDQRKEHRTNQPSSGRSSTEAGTSKPQSNSASPAESQANTSSGSGKENGSSESNLSATSSAWKPQGYAAALLASPPPAQASRAPPQQGSTAGTGGTQHDNARSSNQGRAEGSPWGTKNSFADVVKRTDDVSIADKSKAQQHASQPHKKISEENGSKPDGSNEKGEAGSFRDFGGLTEGENKGRVAFSSRKRGGRADR